MTHEPEHQELWQAVIRQALLDALSHTVTPLEREEARKWLTVPNDHFDFVCELAGKCPIRMRKDAIRALATPNAQFKISKALRKTPGVCADLRKASGTGGGSIAHDFPEIDFSKEELAS